jgi:hypothetical protein
MKHFSLQWISLLLLNGIVLSGCNQHENQADIPNIQDIYRNISYLDSLMQSYPLDSIELAGDQLNNTLQTSPNLAQSPDDKAILDSLDKINSATKQFLRVCTDSRSNLELLKQDIQSVETQYKSGKIKTGVYISTLLEAEQVLVDLYYQFNTGFEQTRQYLQNQAVLFGLLSQPPVTGL